MDAPCTTPVDNPRTISYNHAMILDVVLTKSEEGYAVSCPALKGCWSQGATKAEAVRNIRDAIREYLIVARGLAKKQRGRRMRVKVAA